MHSRSRARTAWLSLTPEPERDLPALLTFLSANPPDPAEHVDARLDGAPLEETRLRREQDAVSTLVLRGNGASWLRYLDRATELALEVADGSRAGDPELALAVAQIVLEHDRMLIGLPGPGYARTAPRRRALRAAIRTLQARVG